MIHRAKKNPEVFFSVVLNEYGLLNEDQARVRLTAYLTLTSDPNDLNIRSCVVLVLDLNVARPCKKVR